MAVKNSPFPWRKFEGCPRGLVVDSNGRNVAIMAPEFRNQDLPTDPIRQEANSRMTAQMHLFIELVITLPIDEFPKDEIPDAADFVDNSDSFMNAIKIAREIKSNLEA